MLLTENQLFISSAGSDLHANNAGNALERVQRVQETRRSLGHHLLHPLILRLLVLCAPAVLRPRALQDAPAPADPNS